MQAKTDFPYQDMANAIRALSMDAVQRANSGHPGMPMGMADVATVLFANFLKFDPEHPKWPDRDRLVLSAGHGSMLLYSLLYLSGYEDISLDDIKNFRKLHSPCAGHPEFGELAGIETTTGPLGQGLATAVGMAIAEKMQAARFSGEIVDHYTYVIAGDGCLMEGISQEAISLAGHLKLNKLVVLFDDNGISIDGKISLSASDDQLARFAASNWDVQQIDGHNPSAIYEALAIAKQSEKPSLIACRTTIAYGAPTKAGSEKSHGAPLGDEEIAGARKILGWPHPPFEIPEETLHFWRHTSPKSKAEYKNWTTRLDAVPQEQQEAFQQAISNELPEGWQAAIDGLKQELSEAAPKDATRKSSEKVLNVLTSHIPAMIGGSADLTGSNNTKTAALNPITPNDFSGRYLYYGIREFGMAAAMNGMALHGGFIPYSGTFLVFSDYCRSAIRLSALMKQRVIYVMTHDSIGLGEDGPTHQPIEHLASLRAMPNLYVFRPADGVETAESWALAVAASETPSLMALSRQGLPTLRTEHTTDNLTAYGGYVLREAEGGQPKAVLLATGSEVHLAVEAQEALEKSGMPTRVVSLPCWELFDAQPVSYRQKVLGGDDVVRVSIEAASTFGWQQYLGSNGMAIGIDSFGASAPASDLYPHFSITSNAVVNAVKGRMA